MAELRYVDWDGLVYYDSKIKTYIADHLEECLKYMGERDSIGSLPDPSYNTLNHIYKITSSFEVPLTSGDFADSARGKVFEANTLICVTNFDGVYLYSIMVEPSANGKTDISLEDYYTKEETEELISDAIKGIEIPSQDLSDYAKKSDIPDTSAFITPDEVANYIPNEYVTSDELEDAIEGIEHPTIPTKVSDLENDLGYITEVAPDDNKLDVSVYEEDKKSFITDVSDKADKEHKHSLSDIEDYTAPDLSEYAKKTELPTDYLTDEDLVGYSKFSGSYNDLTDKPVIPDVSGFITEDALNGYVKEENLPTVPTKVSELENDSGYITEHQDVSGKADKATTLSGYGITDAYTRTEIDTKLLEIESGGKIDEETLKGFVSEDEWNERISAYALKTDIPTDYLKEIPEEYITADELAAEGFIKEHQSLDGYAKLSDIPSVPTKTSELANDSNFITSDALSEYAKSSDIPTDYLTEIPAEYVTETELNAKGYLTEHQDITGKADKDHTHSYNDLTDKPEIPSTDGLASEEWVGQQGYLVESDIANKADKSEIITTTSGLTNDANFTTLEAVAAVGYLTEHQDISGKADNVLFTENYVVSNPMGSFVSGDSVMGMTLTDIIINILGLTKQVTPETPPTTSEVVEEIVRTESPMYQVNENGEVIEISYAYEQMTAEEAAVAPTSDCFYQIIDDNGDVVESGYQHMSVENDSMYYVVALPKGMDFNSNVQVQLWDAVQKIWNDTELEMTCDEEFIANAFAEADLAVPDIDTTKYTLWIDASLNTCDGADYRFIIKE